MRHGAATLLSLVLPILAVSACAGGGGGGTTGTAGTPSTGTTGTATSNVPIYVPNGPATPIYQPVAASGGPNFSSGTQAIAGSAFRLVNDPAFALTSGAFRGIGDYNAQNIGSAATITVETNGYELSIPGLGIDTVLPGDGSSVPVTASTLSYGSSTGKLSLGIELHNYMAGGAWVFTSTDSQATLQFGFAPFVTGYVTPFIPIIGVATYAATGGLSGFAFVRAASGVVGDLSGDVSLSANFGTNTLTGTATNIVATDINNNTSAWNDLAFNATFNHSSAIGGTTSAASAPGTEFALQSKSFGFLGGNFFGPSLDSIGAVWSLGNSDNSGAAYGIIGANITSNIIPSLGDQYLAYVFPSAWTFASGSVPAPLPATRDNVTTPSVFAVPGGQTLNDSTGTPIPYDAGGVGQFNIGRFPVWVGALQFGSGAVSPVANTAGANLILQSDSGGGFANLELSVPSLGVGDLTIPVPGQSPATPTIGPHVPGGILVSYGLSYTGFGAWANSDVVTHVQTSAGYFVYGFETPFSAMPAAGTATYSQTGGVGGTAFVPSGNSVAAATLSGDANLTANFGTGAVSGNFTNMSAYNSNAFTPWNNVSVSASISAGTNVFSGSTAATSAPGGNFALKGNAAGNINGGFYGPNANELGAVWTLSNGDGTGSAIGVVGATKH